VNNIWNSSLIGPIKILPFGDQLVSDVCLILGNEGAVNMAVKYKGSNSVAHRFSAQCFSHHINSGALLYSMAFCVTVSPGSPCAALHWVAMGRRMTMTLDHPSDLPQAINDMLKAVDAIVFVSNSVNQE
jgi:hypothetical protein